MEQFFPLYLHVALIECKRRGTGGACRPPVETGCLIAARFSCKIGRLHNQRHYYAAGQFHERRIRLWEWLAVSHTSPTPVACASSSEDRHWPCRPLATGQALSDHDGQCVRVHHMLPSSHRHIQADRVRRGADVVRTRCGQVEKAQTEICEQRLKYAQQPHSVGQLRQRSGVGRRERS